MLTKLLKAKVHRAVVTFTDLDYHGSITIDEEILEQCGLLPNEAVVVADCENGNRFETYIIPGEAGSGVIGINGAAALHQASLKPVVESDFLRLPELLQKTTAYQDDSAPPATSSGDPTATQLSLF